MSLICFCRHKFPLTDALCVLLHGLAPQERFLAPQAVVDVGDGWSCQVGHRTRQASPSFKGVNLLKPHPGNDDHREAQT